MKESKGRRGRRASGAGAKECGGRYLRGRGENDERKIKIKAGLQFQKMAYALLNRKPHFVKA